MSEICAECLETSGWHRTGCARATFTAFLKPREQQIPIPERDELLKQALAEIDTLRAHNARLEDERNSAYRAMAAARGRADEMEARAFRMMRVCEVVIGVNILLGIAEKSDYYTKRLLAPLLVAFEVESDEAVKVYRKSEEQP